MSSDNLFIEAVAFLLIFILVVFLAYYVTLFLNKKAFNIYKGENFDIVDHLALGKDKNLYIIKVCNEYMLFSATSNSIVYIKTLNEKDLKIKDKSFNFGQSLNISLNNLRRLSIKNLGGNEHDKDKKI
ncbi:flagellar biosynthesis protein, FliO [Thermoanaerobacterium sp. PSU-2]|uniref:flagellar biosynthetic protein FliO n=1 Tax=Thermoanaerobacterium sp. PSU-2 TaxID=1930849 RepID=UPI000A1509AD|nr:flagellar biosynthetic protein FliO [Thermoanaerobacterium sp. PSU-2]ORX24234.1 flagellar biosynthesis protein, FliO [Thermoanaerobacterium sp. PSU-2]